MKHSILLTLACSLLLAGNGWAADMPSANGGSGLIATRTPDVLTRNSWNASGFLNYTGHLAPTDYGYPSGLSRDWSDQTLSGIFNYGFLNNLEGGLVFPIDFSGGPKSATGLQNIDLLGKVEFLNRDNTPISLGSTLVVGIPSASKSDILGSGNANVSIEVNLGYRANEKNRLYANVGFEEGDYFNKAQPALGYKTVPILLASLSYEYAILLEKAYFSVEIVGRSSDIGAGSDGSTDLIPLGQEDIYALFGLRYLPTRVAAITFGLGAGLPDPMRGTTNTLATLGFSYLFNQAKSAARGFTYQKAYTPAPVKPTGMTGGPKVVVVNGCAAGDKAQFFAGKIKTAGFNVVQIGRAPTLTYNDSVVIFNDPYYSQAVNILRMIPGSEKLARSKVKNSIYDIYVVIGCSGVANAK